MITKEKNKLNIRDYENNINKETKQIYSKNMGQMKWKNKEMNLKN